MGNTKKIQESQKDPQDTKKIKPDKTNLYMKLEQELADGEGRKALEDAMDKDLIQELKDFNNATTRK